MRTQLTRLFWFGDSDTAIREVPKLNENGYKTLNNGRINWICFGGT